MKSGKGSWSWKRTRDGLTTTTSFTRSWSTFEPFARAKLKLHVLGRERIAVVELQPLAQLELVGELIGADRPGFGEARRHLVAGHRLHQRVVERVEDPERRELADDFAWIEPHRGEGDVERPAHFTFGLHLGGGLADEAGREQDISEHQTADRETPCGGHRPLLPSSPASRYTPAPS